MKAAQERMKSLPPEMQQKMGALMGGLAGEVNVQKTGETRRIAGYSCEVWAVSIGEMSKTEQCMTTELPLPLQTWDRYKEFSENMKSAMASMGPAGQGMAKMGEKFREMKGLPLATTTTLKLMGHASVSSSEVTEVKKGAIPASAWQIPADYAKVEAPMLKMLQTK